MVYWRREEGSFVWQVITSVQGLDCVLHGCGTFLVYACSFYGLGYVVRTYSVHFRGDGHQTVHSV